MGRFSDNGLKKSTSNPLVESQSQEPLSVDEVNKNPSENPKETKKPVNQYLENSQETSEPINQYSELQMKPVNVGGFRVPLVVRAHWQMQAKFSGEKVAAQLRTYLTERYGLPEGITDDDLMC